MRRNKIIINIILLIAILLFILTIIDYLPLHDIYHDYVSKVVFNQLDTAQPKDLPAWTNTELEWSAVTINYFFKMAATILNIVVILIMRKSVLKSDGKNPE